MVIRLFDSIKLSYCRIERSDHPMLVGDSLVLRAGASDGATISNGSTDSSRPCSVPLGNVVAVSDACQAGLNRLQKYPDATSKERDMPKAKTRVFLLRQGR